MNHLDQIAKRLNVRITDKNLAECLDALMTSVDLANPDEILIHTYKKKSLVKIKGGKFDIYGDEKDEDDLRKFSGLFISLLGWDEHALPIERSKLISYLGPQLDLNASVNRKENNFSSGDPAFTIRAASATHSADKKNAQNPKDAFSTSAATPQDKLEKRAEVWKSRGLEKVDIRDESVWVSVKENVVIEDRGEALKLYGDYDLQAITLMVTHAKETWDNNCKVDGDDKFKTLVWRECFIQGVKLQNFEPDPKEKACIISDIESQKRKTGPRNQSIKPEYVAA